MIEEVCTQPDQVCPGDVSVHLVNLNDQTVEVMPVAAVNVEVIAGSTEVGVGLVGQEDCQPDGQNSVVNVDSLAASGSAQSGADGEEDAKEVGVLTGKDKQMLDQWAPVVYHMPTFFGLLVQIGRLGSDATCHEPVTTERLLALSTFEPVNIRSETFRLLKSAWDLGLLVRKGDTAKHNGAGSVWSFTADGKQYLINGLRT